MNIVVIIPAFNEQDAISKVISEIPEDLVNEIIVVDNNSTDNTAFAASQAGATVLSESVKGYGASCLKGLDYLKNKDIHPDIVVFLDGDYSDYPGEMKRLIYPIINEGFDFVVGSRVSGNCEPGALPPQSRIGSVIAGFLINLFWKFKYTDLGPFRAIKYNKLLSLNMEDKWYGWTVEMQIRAVKNNLRIKEVPVSYRKRIGKSKVTGTFKGSIMAGIIILKTIFKELIVGRKV
ncbi:MAG: glycosyltransferase family 2 protein [Ignavibacteriaceae bacterium]